MNCFVWNSRLTTGFSDAYIKESKTLMSCQSFSIEPGRQRHLFFKSGIYTHADAPPVPLKICDTKSGHPPAQLWGQDFIQDVTNLNLRIFVMMHTRSYLKMVRSAGGQLTEHLANSGCEAPRANQLWTKGNSRQSWPDYLKGDFALPCCCVA